MEAKEKQQDYSKPVAYDVDGRPLYAHPANEIVTEENKSSKSVHFSRPVEIEKPFISVDTKIRHDQSKQHYPGLNLSEGEYVIAEVRRHKIGLLIPFALGSLAVIILLAGLLNYNLAVEMFNLTGVLANSLVGSLLIILGISLVCLFVYFNYFVYTSNKFYLTNESVIEHLQIGLFNRREQTITLGSIEDASYTKSSLLEELVDFGSIRLSTVGDETTYRFKYVAKPKEAIDQLNTAVEAFKNGRPVGS